MLYKKVTRVKGVRRRRRGNMSRPSNAHPPGSGANGALSSAGVRWDHTCTGARAGPGPAEDVCARCSRLQELHVLTTQVSP